MIIGRKEEIAQLRRAFDSDHSEFVAVYGRRRIGKTYLIRETFEKEFTFQYTGIFNVTTREQIEQFYRALLAQGLEPQAEKPRTWFDAFDLLARLIEKSKRKRKVVFIDELPWMSAPNSRFLAAFEHFWNGRASARKDVMLIICGSATSWIINKIFRNRGGLYNRVTLRMKLHQFSLAECEEFARHLGIAANRNTILEGYMVMGGIPYYWSRLDPARSMAQNIDRLFLSENGELRHEFTFVYASMFNRPDKYIKVVEALSGKKSGLTRDEIIDRARMETSGQLSAILADLIECGFVRKYCHPDRKLRDAIYQLVDCYTLFYYSFVKNVGATDDDYWLKMQQTPTYHTWCGLAFERVCLLHLRQIKAALGISGIMVNAFSWHTAKTDYHPGVQIDLLLDRADSVVNVCEMKYSPRAYAITADTMKKLDTKVEVLGQYLSASKSIQPVFVTPNGLAPNKYAAGIHLSVTAAQLFGD